MAFRFSKQFDAETAKVTLDFYLTLSEKDRRRFAVREAKRLGRGGVPCIADLLGCSYRTVERGLTELSELSDDPALDPCGALSELLQQILPDRTPVISTYWTSLFGDAF